MWDLFNTQHNKVIINKIKMCSYVYVQPNVSMCLERKRIQMEDSYN